MGAALALATLTPTLSRQREREKQPQSRVDIASRAIQKMCRYPCPEGEGAQTGAQRVQCAIQQRGASGRLNPG